MTYSSVYEWNYQVYLCTRWMTDEQLELLSPSLMKNLPNTYTFTKKLAEEYLRKEASDLPIAICRPSIVGAAYKEPVDVSSTI